MGFQTYPASTGFQNISYGAMAASEILTTSPKYNDKWSVKLWVEDRILNTSHLVEMGLHFYFTSCGRLLTSTLACRPGGSRLALTWEVNFEKKKKNHWALRSGQSSAVRDYKFLIYLILLLYILLVEQ